MNIFFQFARNRCIFIVNMSNVIFPRIIDILFTIFRLRNLERKTNWRTMSHSVTITRTVTTSNTTSTLVLNTGYLKTLPGLLKLAQLVKPNISCGSKIARNVWYMYIYNWIYFVKCSCRSLELFVLESLRPITLTTMLDGPISSFCWWQQHFWLAHFVYCFPVYSHWAPVALFPELYMYGWNISFDSP